MSIHPAWRAGFELEVVLGDPHFIRELENYGSMDRATTGYCRAVARELRARTGRRWAAPATHPKRPGFHVVSEYDLDPINWPTDRLAGVELLTPPLPLAEAEQVRGEIIAAIKDMDGYFNFEADNNTRNCGWHINIDAGSDVEFDPCKFVVGVDEILLLSRSDRLFTPYTGLQRHAVGIPMLRHLGQDREGKLLGCSGIAGMISGSAGYSKSYAANFDKLSRDYLELRHYSTEQFFNGPSLTEQLDRIPAAFELTFGDEHVLERSFLAKFKLLHSWLESHRDRIAWTMTGGVVNALGEISFDGAPLGILIGDGHFGLNIRGEGQAFEIASISQVLLPDVAEGVALMALDLAELRNLAIKHRPPGNQAFARAVDQLASDLKKRPILSSRTQLTQIHEALKRRSRAMSSFEDMVEGECI